MMNWKPVLENEMVRLHPITPNDFEALYQVASDPQIWEQHPEPNRYERNIFQHFFDSALTANGAFLMYAQNSGALIGSSRYYDFDPDSKEVTIGYTFLAKSCWGKGFNAAIKSLMMDYAFQYVESILFVVGKDNIRSQKAVGKIGGQLIEETAEKIIYAIKK